jgi:AraC-like DNA-binding protein
MDYVKTHLIKKISIQKIVTVHYFEYAKDYLYKGEKHDFWEFLYVDKGEIEVTADIQRYMLRQGEMVFHKPNEFHNLWANGKIAPNLIVISFECKSKAMAFFENKIIQIGDFEKNLLAQIIREAQDAFAFPLNIPSVKKLEKNKHSPFGCEQLFQLYLELFLISLIRKGDSVGKEKRLSFASKENSNEDLTHKIIAYLNENVMRNLSFEDVCRFSNLSKTNLKTIFKETTGFCVMEYFKKLKIEAAKKIIREEQYNFTEVAAQLGFSSLQHFSRRFKKATDMTPSEYASSVKIKVQRQQ